MTAKSPSASLDPQHSALLDAAANLNSCASACGVCALCDPTPVCLDRVKPLDCGGEGEVPA